MNIQLRSNRSLLAQWLRIHCLCAPGLLIATGCDSAERFADKSGPADDLFASARVFELVLDLAPSELETLKQSEDSHAYIRCTVRESGRSISEVGIHCRGNPKSELASGKPDFTVGFDKFVSGQKFYGVRRLTLQACREDPSYLAAPVGFEMFRQAGVPAPRCAFARVNLNGRDLGLYVIIEGVDPLFLRQNFRQPKGNLYDEGKRTDVTGRLEKDRGADPDDQSDIDALAAAALQTDPALRWKQLEQRLDVNRFAAFTALEVLLWQKDSYTLEARKFRIYHDPETDRLVFFPKGIERVLEKTDGPILPKCKGVVAKAVLTTPEGEKLYRQTMRKLLDTVFNPAQVQARSQQLAAVIRPTVAARDADAGKAFDAAVASFCDAVSRRASFAAEQLKTSPAQ